VQGWQVHAFSTYFLVLRRINMNDGTGDDNLQKNEIASEAANFCLDMCHDIVRSPSWRMLSRGRSFYPNLVTVEIACGLDAVMQGSRVAFEEKREEDLKLLLRNADNAVEFLCWAQDRVPEDAIVGYGGLGYGGLQVMEQRLDVTGHALSGMSKLVCNV